MRPFAACLLAGCLVVFAGCATVDPYASNPIAQHLLRDDAVGYCARLFADIDRRVDALDRRDGEATRVEGFPYLRIDRFNAALAPRSSDGAASTAWLDRLVALDDAGRTAELANAELPADDVVRCRKLLTAADRENGTELQKRATVPDDYSDAMRALGLYPLTRLAFAAGISRWHDETLADFAAPLAQLPRRGQLTRYAVDRQGGEATMPAPRDVLGVPLLSRSEQRALLERHAPLLEIDVARAFDRPGAVVLNELGEPVVDPETPSVYSRVSYALLNGRPHIQLIYTFWFTERPARSALDLLSGRLDGLIWRVTLDADGAPLVFDSIHACGCYHLFFPTERVAARLRDDGLNEGLFAPQRVRAPGSAERVVLRIESGTHYIQRVLIEPHRDGAIRLQLDEDRHLASLPFAGGGTRSAYGSDRLMAGSERGERFIFWPMGIESAGQQRQWGHHATAFVGRRHFDDPLLLDSYFIVPPAASIAP